MGQPGTVKQCHLLKERTQGTETSKYLEERKATCDSVSSGERKRIDVSSVNTLECVTKDGESPVAEGSIIALE